ncbi:MULTISPECIES: colibactin biosynthesis dehydrogenase ClbF [unclassified Gilliamella]|uniref:colibactin biosynthesis dehydrogenase ClbF n=1 Tax=unclassified Gilliamella TaxID=2685620 RepID=UPI00080E215D|nr:colibactin biosynthesis dehydrogenase ClbF [Gilliamella apicola]OCG20185.1 acyl-CoA dehydrogenase [Gilliamella apicola]OCG21779.1 acyl-CoA dehydrogenase [Gilliamella apicola]
MLKEYNIILRNVNQFVKSKLNSVAAQIEREQFIDSQTISQLAKEGYLGASISKKYGGSQMDSYQLCALHEVIAGVHGSLENLITVTGMVSIPIQRAGNKIQKEYYLPKLASGELIGAIALTEPNIGSDLANVETQLTRDGDGWRLNGKKKWITLSQIADFFIVLTRCGNQMATVIIDRNTKGFTITPIRDMLGLRGNMLAELNFDNCRLENEALLGQISSGVPLSVNFALNEGRFTTACGSLGLCQGAVDITEQYIRRRKQFKHRLFSHGIVQHLFTKMLTQTRSARLLCFSAANYRENLHPDMINETLMAKYVSSTAAVEVTSNAVQLLGANGCQADMNVERYYRDAKIMEIIEGTTQIHEIQIAMNYMMNGKRSDE